MQRKSSWASVFILLLLLTSGAWASDTIMRNGVGSWQALPNAAGLDDTPPPFWDSLSLDGAQKNVGYLLQPYHPLDYYAFNNLVDPDVSFTTTESYALNFEFLFAIGQNSVINQLYVYDVNHPTTQQILVFTGGASPGNTASVNIPDSWSSGFGFLLVGGDNTRFYSTPGVTGATSDGNFAFFAPTGSYTSMGNGRYLGSVWYVGVEDVPVSWPSSDKYYKRPGL